MAVRFNVECIKMKDYSSLCGIKLETGLFMLHFEIRLSIFDQKREAQLT